MVELRMDPLSWLRKQLETADVDLLREMVRSFAGPPVRASSGSLGDILVTNSPVRIGFPIPAHHKSGILAGQDGIGADHTAAGGPRTGLVNTVGLSLREAESRLRREVHGARRVPAGERPDSGGALRASSDLARGFCPQAAHENDSRIVSPRLSPSDPTGERPLPTRFRRTDIDQKRPRETPFLQLITRRSQVQILPPLP